MRERSVVRSSVIPSAKYSCSGSLLRLAKGSTTIERRGAGNGWGDDETAETSGPACRPDHSHHAPPPAVMMIAAAAAPAMTRVRLEPLPRCETAAAARASEDPATLKARTGSAIFLTR